MKMFMALLIKTKKIKEKNVDLYYAINYKLD